MRFTTSNLLLLTTIAAFYAAGLWVAPLPLPRWIDALFLGPVLAVLPFLLWGSRTYGRTGEPNVTWIGGGALGTHLVFAAIYLGTSCFLRSRGLPGAWFQVGTVLPNHLLFVAMSVVRLGPAGLAVGGKFLPRHDYTMTLDKAGCRLIVQAKVAASAATWQFQRAKPLPIHARNLEAVQAILARS